LSFQPDVFQSETDNKQNLGLTLNYRF